MLIDGKEWKLVPVELTDAMIQAARGAARAFRTQRHFAGSPQSTIYQAMLAAAPTPPAATAAPSDEEIHRVWEEVHAEWTIRTDIDGTWLGYFARALLSRYGQAPAAMDADALAERVRRVKAEQAPAASAEPIRLQHLAVADEHGLRWMSGRRMPMGVESVELYAMPEYGRAPDVVYAVPVATQAPVATEDVLDKVLKEVTSWIEKLPSLTEGALTMWFKIARARALKRSEEELKNLFDLIDQERFDDARAVIATLENKLGKLEPELIRASTLIRFLE